MFRQEVLGRLVLPVKVCAAPKRDCTAEENKVVTAQTENPAESDEDTEDLGPLDSVYSIPVSSVGPHVLCSLYVICSFKFLIQTAEK